MNNKIEKKDYKIRDGNYKNEKNNAIRVIKQIKNWLQTETCVAFIKKMEVN